jgi:hypothetical protein
MTGSGGGGGMARWRGAVEHRGIAHKNRIGVDVKVILTPPCVFLIENH